MEKVKYGIIGLGNMGRNHLRNFFKGRITNGVCTAIADIDADKLKAAQEMYPSDYEVFETGAELIEKANVDAVLIAIPHYDHPGHAIQALKRGLNVICEKPAGVYTKQVKEMNEVAKASGKLFTMMYNQRTNPLYKKMREMIVSGEIGEVRRVNWIITNWFRTQYYYDSGEWRATWSGEGGGVLLNQCPHQLDLLQWVCNMMPTKIRAFCHFGKWHDIETEDDVTAYMEFPNGATGAFIASTGDTPGSNRLEIIGSKGKLLCENDKDTLIIYRLNADVADVNEYLKTAKNAYGQPEFTEETVYQNKEQNTQHVGIINNFTNCILGLESLYVDGIEGIHCVQLMNAMLLSTFQDRTVSLPIDDEEYWQELSKRIKTSRRKEKLVGVKADDSITFGDNN